MPLHIETVQDLNVYYDLERLERRMFDAVEVERTPEVEEYCMDVIAVASSCLAYRHGHLFLGNCQIRGISQLDGTMKFEGSYHYEGYHGTHERYFRIYKTEGQPVVFEETDWGGSHFLMLTWE